jgi:hypothetical protein
MDVLHGVSDKEPVVAGHVAAPPEAGDVLEAPASPRYCPIGLLRGFALLMAGHGRCVNTDMMLGDREYAMWQLGCARAMEDPELSALASRLFAYFDDPQHSGLVVLGTA